MRIAAVMLTLCCCVSAVTGQWVETTIQLSGLDSICTVQFHSPNHTVYVGGNRKLLAVDAGTHRTMARTTCPGVFTLMCSSTGSNKLYCTSVYQDSVWVMDCATNQLLPALWLQGPVSAMCYAAASNKVYVACPPDNVVAVIDCETDIVVARIEVPSWPSALCYNPELDRIYSAQSESDEVAVIDCTADTVIRTIWVRGIKPIAICYDSVNNCVYAANYKSGTASVIDCVGDSVVRIVTVGARPERIEAGPAGKVYCGVYGDSVLTVITAGATRTIPVGRDLSSMCSDPVNGRVYCATSDSEVLVIDAVGDTVMARAAAGEDLRLVCYNPVDTSTWAAGTKGATVGVIDGATSQLIDMLFLGAFDPGALCCSPVNNRLYCLGQGGNQAHNLLYIIDGDSNLLLRALAVDSSADSMVWNPVNNKVYISNPAGNTVSVLDCASDSITATVQTADGPGAMCRSDDGKIYVTTKAGGVAVIDPGGDSIRAVVPTPYDPTSLCYDRTDNKVYASHRLNGLVSVIDADGDTVVAAVPVPESCHRVCWNQNHNKVYVCADYAGLAVIDCTRDTVLRILDLSLYPGRVYSDSASDKIYMCGDKDLYIFDAATDSLLSTTRTYALFGFIDNGRPGDANRLYSTCYDYRSEGLYVVGGANDSILRLIEVGVEPKALAWNPAQSRIYVSNSGSSSITVVSDTMLGIEEGRLQAPSYKPQATVVRGVLFLLSSTSSSPSWLLDAAGRRVMDLSAGANDVSKLAPGVYFVREAQAHAQALAVRKVVIAK